MKYQQLDNKKKEEVKRSIYYLRKKGLTYASIMRELEEQGIKISRDTVVGICRGIDVSREKTESMRRRDKNELIYTLRKKGLTFSEIEQEFNKQGMEISKATIERRYKEICISKGEYEKQIIDELIFSLREQGLSYRRISEELEKQGINISRITISIRCKAIYTLKGKKEPNLHIKIQVNDELIYNLREEGLSYKKIVEELEKQGIKLSYRTVRDKCKHIYYIKGEEDPKIKRSKEINKKIYELREEGFSYADIVRQLKEQELIVNYQDVVKRCKEIYASKEKKDINSMQERKQRIYNLRQQGWTYKRIAEEFGVCTNAVAGVCKRMYDSKGEEIPKSKRKEHNKISDRSKELDETIYNLREQGLTYPEISDKLKEKGTTLTKQRVQQRHKRFLKLNEQQLAKAILNLTITRKATIEQIQQIAEYYGVDLEKTMNSIEER